MSAPAAESIAAATDPRVYFAAERTLLAWVRTGVSLMGFGFVVARFGLFLRQFALMTAQPGAAPAPGTSPAPGLSLYLGVALALLGVAANVLAAVQYSRTLARLRRGETYEPPPLSLAVAVSFALALVGLSMAAYLSAYAR